MFLLPALVLVLQAEIEMISIPTYGQIAFNVVRTKKKIN